MQSERSTIWAKPPNDEDAPLVQTIKLIMRIMCVSIGEDKARERQHDTVAEWLRRQPAKLMGFARVGSNPIGVDFTYFRNPKKSSPGAGVCVCLFYYFFFFLLIRKM